MGYLATKRKVWISEPIVARVLTICFASISSASSVVNF